MASEPELDRSSNNRLTETKIQNIESFLALFSITAFEAQIIFEVAGYRQHHIDTLTLAKKIPKIFFEDPSNNVANSVKNLKERKFLRPYVSKKAAPCVHCDKLGRDVARLIRSQGFAEYLQYFDESKRQLTTKMQNLCLDPLGLEIGEERFANGSKDKIKITVKSIGPSKTVYGEIDGKVVFEREVVIDVECPRCGFETRISYSYNPLTVWQKYQDIECASCTYFFSVRYSLMEYYEL